MKRLLNKIYSVVVVPNFYLSTTSAYSQLCRSYMYVPGDKMKMIFKTTSMTPSEAPDIIVLDLEDGVGMENKDFARNNIYSVVESGELKKAHSPICIRVNSLSAGNVVENDLDLISKCLKVSNYRYPEMITLPKVESVDDVAWIDNYLKKKIDVNQLKQPLKLGILIESCASIMRLQNLCEKLMTTKWSCLKINHAGFGSDDYCASLGVSRSASNIEVQYARQYSANTFRAFNILAIDMVDIDLNNVEALEKNCKVGASFGFQGKQVIHPKQLPIVNAAFSPSIEKSEWAEKLLKAYESQKEFKRGVFVFMNQMIDMPTILQAEKIVYAHNLIKSKSQMK